jgi:pyruvate dehydrogenase E1 component
MNLFLLLGAAGLSHSLFGKRLIPIGTVYDPFVARGLDALNYACYQDARFMIVGTPSGVTLAPEGGAHQSIGSPLIGMSQDGLAAFEPAFADELAVIMEWAFDYMQRMAKAIRTNAPGCATRPAARSISGSPPTRSSSLASACRRGFPPGRD